MVVVAKILAAQEALPVEFVPADVVVIPVGVGIGKPPPVAQLPRHSGPRVGVIVAPLGLTATACSRVGDRHRRSIQQLGVGPHKGIQVAILRGQPVVASGMWRWQVNIPPVAKSAQGQSSDFAGRQHAGRVAGIRN